MNHRHPRRGSVAARQRQGIAPLAHRGAQRTLILREKHAEPPRGIEIRTLRQLDQAPDSRTKPNLHRSSAQEVHAGSGTAMILVNEGKETRF